MNTEDVAWRVLDQLVRSEVLMFGGRHYVHALAAHLEVEVSVIYRALSDLVRLEWVNAPGDLQRRLTRPRVTPAGYQAWLSDGRAEPPHDFEAVKHVVLREIEHNAVSVEVLSLHRKLRKQDRIERTRDDLQIDLRLLRGAGLITTNPALGLQITSYAGPLYQAPPLASWHL